MSIRFGQRLAAQTASPAARPAQPFWPMITIFIILIQWLTLVSALMSNQSYDENVF